MKTTRVYEVGKSKVKEIVVCFHTQAISVDCSTITIFEDGRFFYLTSDEEGCPVVTWGSLAGACVEITHDKEDLVN